MRMSCALAVLGAISFSAPAPAAQAARPNVLFVICDDLNDSVEGLGGHPQARTPNLDRFAGSAVRFQCAYSNNPVCGPSRGSLWTGLYPHTTGLYGHDQNNYTWRDTPLGKKAVTLFEHFQRHGYDVRGTGKIFHNNHHTVPLFGKENFGAPASFGPWPWDGKAQSPFATRHPASKPPWGGNGFETMVPLSEIPSIPSEPGRGVPGYTGWRDLGKPFRYVSDEDRDPMIDEQSVAFVRKVLSEKRDRPLLLAVGFLRPHCPWVVPKKYFDLFPLEGIRLPPYRANDLEDCGRFIPEMKASGNEWYLRLERLREAYGGDVGWRMWIRAYLACAAFVDDQFGQLMAALEAAGLAESTIVVFTSDHGFHMGEKDLLCKKTCWEEATRVPLLIRAPGVGAPGTDCREPVSLVDLYPTLLDLCGLPPSPNEGGNGRALDGHSLRPLLADPASGKWSGPEGALSCIEGGEAVQLGAVAPPEQQHFTVRARDWRYVRYADGDEELYDHRTDPLEWTNLAGKPEHAGKLSEMRKRLAEQLAR